MPKQLPYFCWYPADAETDENFRSMTDQEVGFYLRCLNHTWINGSIPADPAERARVMQRSKKVADRMWLRVGRCFSPSNESPQRLVNRRQEREREIASSRIESARSAGIKSGEERRKKGTTVQVPLDFRSNDLRTRASVSVSVSESESTSEKEKPSTRAREPQPDNFRAADLEQLLGIFIALGRGLTVKDRIRCENAWKGLPDHDRSRALSYVIESLTEWRSRPTSKIAQPWNYLEESHWTRAGPRLLPVIDRKSAQIEQEIAAFKAAGSLFK